MEPPRRERECPAAQSSFASHATIAHTEKMDLISQMTTFVRVAETRSFSAAARSQKLSVAAVSRQISALEDELRVRLVARTSRRLSLTEEGQRWYESSLRVLRTVDEARASVDPDAPIAGRLVISVGYTLANAWVVPRLSQTLRQHPGLRLELRVEDRVADLLGDAVDLAIRGNLEPPDNTRLIARTIASFERCVVASPTYLRRRGTPRQPEDLCTHDGLVQLPPAGGPLIWRFRQGEIERPIEITSLVSTGTPTVTHALALDGHGIAMLPEWLVARDLEEKKLKRVLADWRFDPVKIFAIYRKEMRGAKAIRVVLEALSRQPWNEPARQEV